MQTTTTTTETTMTESLAEGRFGTPEPQICVSLPKGSSYRLVNAALHDLAAAIERSTPDKERWSVVCEHDRVFLELSKGTREEALRGMALLKTIVR